MDICVAVPVWGKEFINIYFTYGVKSQLSSGNLEVISSDSNNVIFRFYTRKEDVAEFYQYESFQVLSKHTNIDFVFIGDWIDNEPNKYLLMTRCHNDAITFCKNSFKKSMLFLHTADMIFANNIYEYSLQFVDKGKKAFALFAIPTEARDMLAACEKYLSSDNSCYDIPPEKLAYYSAKNSCVEIFCVESKVFNSYGASVFLWRMDNGSLLLRAFFINPFMIVIEEDSRLIALDSTLDADDFYADVDRMEEELEILTDSGTFVSGLEFTSRMPEIDCGGFIYYNVGYWGSVHAKPLNLEIVKKHMFIGDSECPSALNVINKSDRVINKILAIVQLNIFINDWTDFQLKILESYYNKEINSEYLESFLKEIRASSEILQSSSDNVLCELEQNFEKIYLIADESLTEEARLNILLSFLKLFTNSLNELYESKQFKLIFPLDSIDLIINKLKNIQKEHVNVCIYGLGFYGRFVRRLISINTSLIVKYVIDDNVSIGDDYSRISVDDLNNYSSDITCVLLCSNEKNKIESLYKNCENFSGKVVAMNLSTNSTEP